MKPQIVVWLVVTLFGCTSCASAELAPPRVPDRLSLLPPESVRLGGPLGEAIDRSMTHRIAAQDVGALIQPFRDRRDRDEWRSEFWGKWITSAIAVYRYSGDAKLRAAIARAVSELLATQSPDGYIGAYPDGGHLQRWDVWGRKYTLLGLLAWHEATGDAAVLAAAQRHADFILSEIGPGRASPFTNDMWNGMASSSVIEPMMLLHRRTGERRYLEFCDYVVRSWPQPDGPDLLNKALAHMPVFEMFPGPKPHPVEYVDGGHSKAYEMMSCFEGLAELYRSTGDARYADAVRSVYRAILDREITVIGSGSDWERWSDGRQRQTQPWVKGMETCVTVTWMKLASQVLRLTGDSSCMDEIERATFNALLGAQSPDGAWWCHHSPLAGVKERAPEQCDMPQNCCVANGPRGLLLLPQLAVMNGPDGPVVNLYGPMQASLTLTDGVRVTLRQVTDYPFDETVRIELDLDQPHAFSLGLRVPAWSEQTRIAVNGTAVSSIASGTYARLQRRWQRGDVIELQLDLRTRAHRALGNPTHVAFTRGPLVLAQDGRLGGDVEAPIALAIPSDGIVSATAVEPASLPRQLPRAYRVGPVLLCDFASAGNTWAEDSRFRVWMPLAKAGGNAAAWSTR